MRSVSGRRLATFALLVVLSAQGAFAAPPDRNRNWGARIKHLIVAILDQLGGPNP